MSLPSRRKLWSVLTYDLKTAVDVCGLPSLLKTPSRVTSHYTLLPLATKVKIEAELVIYAAHIRVIDYADPNWIIQKKGRDYYEHRSQFLDCELLVPLSYPGLVRLYHNKKTRTYVNISEVAEDFPRLVQVDQDVACLSPGEDKPQVVRKGTLLQLDRLTKSTQMIRGMSETYLLVFEVGTGKEYAFPLLCAIQFTEVVDTFKYTLKEIIDQLPLPRTVQFVGVNPHDVIVVDDEEAVDVLSIVDGPLEIVGMRRVEMLIGLYKDYVTEQIEMVAIPKEDSLFESISVHIPSSCLVNNDKTFADKVIPEKCNLELLQEKLYVLYVDDIVPAFLKNIGCIQRYDIVDTPATPPLPPRNYGKKKLYVLYVDDIVPAFLKNNGCIQRYDIVDAPPTPPLPPRNYDLIRPNTHHSTPHLGLADGCSVSRKRFRSMGDIRHFRNRTEESDEDAGVRGFFRSLSRRFKRRGSLPVHNSFDDPVTNTDLNQTYSSRLPSRSKKHLKNIETENFVCYLNEHQELTAESDFHKLTHLPSGTQDKSELQNIPRSPNESRTVNQEKITDLDSDIACCKAENEANEIIYASINWESKTNGVVQVKEKFYCDICKMNFLAYNGSKRNSSDKSS